MNEPDAAAVVVTRLRKCYGRAVALHDVSITIRTGECLAIVGPDGAGKTTLLKILANILEPSSGQCLIAGKTPAEARTLVGYMTQGFSWCGHLSTIENLQYAGELRGVSTTDIAERAAYWLNEFGINHVRDRAADKLSGGMKQKLALAAALIGDPPILLLDEPTTGVDPLSRRDFWSALLRLVNRGKTIVVATPDIAEARRCGRIAALAEGRVQHIGEPDTHELVRSTARWSQPACFVDVRDVGDVGNVAIAANALHKTYATFAAVNDVTLTVRYGEVVALLGANGAGKTTTMKMLTGLISPSSGVITVGGAPPAAVRDRIGYMSQKCSLYDDLSIHENLEFFAGVYGLSGRVRDDRVATALKDSGLAGREHTLVGTLPGGWKQRLAFFAALMHRPKILFLDEPTSGMDIASRRAVWAAIEDVAHRGAAVIVTTHYIEESEQCHRIAFMTAGRLTGCQTQAAWKSGRKGQPIEAATTEPEKARTALLPATDEWRITTGRNSVRVIARDPALEAAQLNATLRNAGIDAGSFGGSEWTLEEVFVDLTASHGRPG